MKVAIVGAGHVGSVLGKILQQNGQSIVCVVSRTMHSARRAGKFLRCRNFSTSLAEIPRDTDLVLIATPHGAIQTVADELSAVTHLRFGKLAVCHASGMLTAEVLAPLRAKGATVFSFHPLQTFPRDFEPRDILPMAKGIYYGVDGNEMALRKAKRLAAILKGKTIVIRPEMRTLYHAACVVASNHLTTMLWVLEKMFSAMKTNERKFYPVFEPIINATLKNVERTSPAQALSGPIARGGTETIAGHFESLRRFAPDLVSYYAGLSEETTRLAEAKGSINSEQADALRRLIAPNMRSSM